MPEYFSHDYDSREDEKIIALMAEMGWAGYGLYWGIVELLYKNNGKMRTNYQRVAFALNSHPDHIQQIIENFDLFQIKKGFFTSQSIIKRLSKRREKSEVGRANAYKRWKNEDANPLPTLSQPNAKKERKVNKEKKVNSIGKKFIKPTLDEVKKYCNERGKGVNPVKWFNHYTSNGWKVGKNPMVDWHAAVHTWEESDIGANGKLPASPGTNLGSDPLPKDYGQPSPTAVDRETYLKTKKDKS